MNHVTQSDQGPSLPPSLPLCLFIVIRFLSWNNPYHYHYHC